MSSTLQAGTAPVLNRVVITNLQQGVDEDRIVLHLEQRKVTLVDDVEVTAEEFDETNHAAIVIFTDASGRPVSLVSLLIGLSWFFVQLLIQNTQAGRYLRSSC